jgi:hypothetical protein
MYCLGCVTGGELLEGIFSSIDNAKTIIFLEQVTELLKE